MRYLLVLMLLVLGACTYSEYKPTMDTPDIILDLALKMQRDFAHLPDDSPTFHFGAYPDILIKIDESEIEA